MKIKLNIKFLKVPYYSKEYAVFFYYAIQIYKKINGGISMNNFIEKTSIARKVTEGKKM